MNIKVAPELLMPAGSPEKMYYAFTYGADAVYAGAPIFSLRARENEFSLQQLSNGIEYARNLGKKLYVTANIFARNVKLAAFERSVAEWAKLKPDAMIMSDPGLMLIVREKYPEIPIHLSVQANCTNWQSVKFWQKAGASRIILSRELRLEEIKEIKQRVPDIELEAFVHGAICIAYSGRCLLSHYMSYRDANQGVCDNSCRYGYNVHKTEGIKSDDEYFLEDLREKGQFYQIDEDEHGTYIMNAKDLCLIEHLKEIAEAGVCSFKVEGRTKTVYYAAMVSKLYRKAIDEMMAGLPFDKSLLSEMQKIGNRGYHKGFMIPGAGHEMQNYTECTATQASRVFAGMYKGPANNGSYSLVDVRAKVQCGDTIEVIEPFTEPKKVQITQIINDLGEPVNVAHGGKKVYQMDLGYTPKSQALFRLI